MNNLTLFLDIDLWYGFEMIFLYEFWMLMNFITKWLVYYKLLPFVNNWKDLEFGREFYSMSPFDSSHFLFLPHFQTEVH